MNVLKRALQEAAVEVDQYKREQQFNLARCAFFTSLLEIVNQSDDTYAVEHSPEYLEARAIHAYMVGNPWTKLGQVHHKRADGFIDQAIDNAPSVEADAIMLRFKAMCHSVDSIMQFDKYPTMPHVDALHTDIPKDRY